MSAFGNINQHAEPSSKRQKPDEVDLIESSLGPMVEGLPMPGIRGPGLLCRQMTLDADNDDAIPATRVPDISNHACFAAGKFLLLFSMKEGLIKNISGCYWGTEQFLKYDFGKKYFVNSGKVLSGAVGFMGPPTAMANPSYPQVRFCCNVYYVYI